MVGNRVGFNENKKTSRKRKSSSRVNQKNRKEKI
jgi:hypothetical protein